MKNWTYQRFIFLSALIILLGWVILPAHASTPSDFPKQSFRNDDKKPKYMKGQIIVKFKESLLECPHCLLKNKKPFRKATTDNSDSLDRILTKYKVENMQPLFRQEAEEKKILKSGTVHLQDLKKYQKDKIEQAGNKFTKRKQRAAKGSKIPNLHHVYLIKIDQDADIAEAVKEFAQNPHVEYAQPDYFTYPAFVPNDPVYKDGKMWGLEKIKMPQAWDISQGEENVTVAVIDGGVNFTHPDIADNIWHNWGEDINGDGILNDSDRNQVDDDQNGYADDFVGLANSDSLGNAIDPWEEYGHGTLVAGVIAAVSNDIGVIGVAPKVKIMPLIWGSDAYTARAFEYAALNGADIISNSWGTYESPVLREAIQLAYSMGAVVIFAAGNTERNVANEAPVNVPEVIRVAASNASDEKADFSNFGTMIDVAAPGVDIWSLVGSHPDGDFQPVSGTSFAAPHVAGLAALLLSVNPNLGVEDVRQILRASSDDRGPPGFDIFFGFGRINALEALQLADNPNGVPVTLKIQEPGPFVIIDNPTGPITITGTAYGPQFSNYELYYSVHDYPIEWILFKGPINSPVQDGFLGSLDVQGLKTEQLLLRLVVTTIAGKEFEDIVEVFLKLPYEQLESGLKILNTDPNPDGPQISNNKVMWKSSTSSRQIPYFDFLRPELGIQNIPVIIPASYIASITLADDQVAWINDQNMIFVHDLTIGQQKHIATFNGLSSLTISNNYAAWLGDNNTGIYLHHFTENIPPISLPTTSQEKNSITLNSGRLVWDEVVETIVIGEPPFDSIDKYSDIFTKDINSPSQPQHVAGSSIKDGGSRSSLFSPKIFENLIVWNDNRFVLEPSDIYYYELNKTNPPKRVYEKPAHRIGPSVSGNIVAWQEETALGGWDIFYRDLKKGEPPHRITYHPSSQIAAQISGNKIAWLDFRNYIDGEGEWKIYWYEIPPDLPDLIITQSFVGLPAQGGINGGEFTAQEGDPLFFTATFVNQGWLDAGAHKLSFYFGTTLAASCNIPSMAPSELQTYVCGPWAATPGTHQIKAVIDDGNQILESDENNNESIKTLVVANTKPPVISSPKDVTTLAYGTTQTIMTVNTNENATCKYDTLANKSYAAMRYTFSTTGGTTHSQPVTGLVNGGIRTIYVICYDSAGNANTTDYMMLYMVRLSTTDLTAPSPAPSNLTATALSPTQVKLQWTGSTDPGGLYYRIYRRVNEPNNSFVYIGTATTIPYTDSFSLIKGKQYIYKIVAYDNARNLTTFSNETSVTIP